MLTAIITANTIEDVPAQITQAADCDLLEWRLDYLTNLDLTAIAVVMKTLKKPVIFTLRPLEGGGEFDASESERLALLISLASLKPDYIDLENFVPDTFFYNFAAQFPDIKIIRSYHNFEVTPPDLDKVLTSLSHPAVTIYKIVTQAHSSLEALRMLHFVKHTSQTTQIIGHCLGEFGQFSRICGAVVGNAWTYASLDETQQNIGILSVKSLLTIYRMDKLTAHTQIYALLGDPVASSIGHRFHNDFFAEAKRQAIYVKIRLRAEELLAFFELISGLPFAGFSVTIPLKEAICPFVSFTDPAEKKLGACNTLRRALSQSLFAPPKVHWQACNTDGLGAVQALEPIIDLTGKSVLLLGAGGAALGIANALLGQAAKISVINRTLQRSLDLAAHLGGNITALATLRDLASPDVIIQTRPGSIELPTAWVEYLRSHLTQKSVVMDIDYRTPNLQLQALMSEFKCQEVPGRDMFTHQALAQQAFWFPNTPAH